MIYRRTGTQNTSEGRPTSSRLDPPVLKKIAKPLLVAVMTMAMNLPGTDHVLAGSGSWTTEAPMHRPRLALAAGVVNGILYAVGGYGLAPDNACPNIYCATVEAYDPSTNTWTSRAPMPSARDSLAVGVVNRILYAVGGYNEFAPGNCLGTCNTVEAYDPSTDTWTTKAAMPTGRRGIAAGVVNGILYAVGGYSGACGGDCNTVEAYDPSTDTWTAKAAMPTPRSWPAVGVVNGILYVVGGSRDSGVCAGFCYKVEAYDPSTNAWTTKKNMPTPRFGLAVGVVNGILYAVGGDASGYWDVVEAYDPSTDTWTMKAPLPTLHGRAYLAAGVVNGLLYAVGGIDADQHVDDTNEAFTEIVPFAAFSATVNVSRQQLLMRGEFTLGAGGDCCNTNPMADNVTLQIGDFSGTVFGGSLSWHTCFISRGRAQQGYYFSGIINGGPLIACISPDGGNKFAYAFSGESKWLLSQSWPFRRPVAVGLTIGTNRGNTSVTPIFH